MKKNYRFTDATSFQVPIYVCLGQIITRPYLNLLVKPRIFFKFSGKKYNYMHFEMRNAFQNA